MGLPENNLKSLRVTAVYKIITPVRLWYFFLILLSLISALFLLEVPRPEVVPVIALALVIGLIFFFYPWLGVFMYIILSYMRFEETIPVMASLHLAKILTMTLVLVWAIRAAINKSRLYLLEEGLLIFYLLCLSMILSIPLSFWPTRSLNSLAEVLKMLVFIVLFIHLIDNERKLKMLFWIFLAVNCFLAITAVKEFLILGGAAALVRPGGSGGFLQDANDFALALSVALPFSFYFFISELKKAQKFFFFLSFILLTLGVISTVSRGGFITLIFLFIYFSLKSKNRLVGILSIILILILILAFAPHEYWQRQMTITSYQQDESAMGRIGAWKAGIRMFADRPLLGVGAGAYDVAFGVKYGVQNGPWFVTHNAYIQIAAELGIFGLLFYLGLMIYIYRQATVLISSSAEDNYIKTVSNGLRAALLAYAVGSFFLSVAYYFHLYFLLGITIVLRILEAKQGETSLNRQESQK